MNLEFKKYYPFYGWSAFLILGGINSLNSLISEISRGEPNKVFLAFFSLITFWTLFTGIGILLRKKWTYYSLQVFISFLFFVFPVGTILAVLTNKYIKENNAKIFFEKRSQHNNWVNTDC